MIRNILFLCTANSARSILAEAVLAKLGEGRFTAFSAGSHPRGVPNPLALQFLAAEGHDVSGFRSKSWDEFAQADSPPIHCVITVCDNAAGETCPIWPGHPVQAHWGIPDPAGNSSDGRIEDFGAAYQRLEERVRSMLELDENALEPRAWRDALIRIGREAEGSTAHV